MLVIFGGSTGAATAVLGAGVRELAQDHGVRPSTRIARSAPGSADSVRRFSPSHSCDRFGRGTGHNRRFWREMTNSGCCLRRRSPPCWNWDWQRLLLDARMQRETPIRSGPPRIGRVKRPSSPLKTPSGYHTVLFEMLRSQIPLDRQASTGGQKG